MEAIHVGPAFVRGAKENGWEPANASEFKLRGKNYLNNKVKVPSEPSAFRLVGVSQCCCSLVTGGVVYTKTKHSLEFILWLKVTRGCGDHSHLAEWRRHEVECHTVSPEPLYCFPLRSDVTGLRAGARLHGGR